MMKIPFISGDKGDEIEAESDDVVSGLSGHQILLDFMRKHKVVDRQKERALLKFTETQMNRYQKQVMKTNNLEIRKNLMRPKHRTLVLIED